MTEIVWFCRRFSFGGIATSISSPSTYARMNPCLRTVSNSSRNSPFRPCTSGARTSMRVSRGQVENDVGDLRGALALHRPAAVRAVRRSGARPEQAQIVVDLGDRADRRPRIVAGGLLLDRDRGRQPFDRVDVGLFHQPEELARVRRQRLDVPALAFGVDRVERERRLARARQPGDDRQLIARDRDVDVSEVVLPRAANDQRIFCHSRGKLRRRTA